MNSRSRLAHAIAVFVVAAQVAAMAHMALVRHGTCFEHGELVELGPSRPSAHAVAARTNSDAASALDADVDEIASFEHDHCIVAVHLRERTTAPAGSGTPVSLLGDEPGSACGTLAAIPPRVALFVIAPKASPPV